MYRDWCKCFNTEGVSADLELRIEIDLARQERQVAEITDSDYFRSLRERAEDLRRTFDG